MDSDPQQIINIITNISQRVIGNYGWHAEKERCLRRIEFGEWGADFIIEHGGQGGSHWNADIWTKSQKVKRVRQKEQKHIKVPVLWAYGGHASRVFAWTAGRLESSEPFAESQGVKSERKPGDPPGREFSFYPEWKGEWLEDYFSFLFIIEIFKGIEKWRD